MLNAKLATKGDILTITVDLSQDSGPSKSMKSIIIASSQGAVDVEGTDIKVNLNVYRPRA